MRPVRIAASLSIASLLAAHPAWGAQDGDAAAPTGSGVAADDGVTGGAAGQSTDGSQPELAVEPSAEMRAAIRERLSRSFAARARIVLQREIVFLGVLGNSQTLMRAALDLEPANPAIWRLALDLAAIAEDGDPAAESMLGTALAVLSRMEPDDEVLRLRRVIASIDARQTAEERVAAMRSLLGEDAVATLGPRVAARIAFDLALLLRQTGDLDGFARNLIRALDLDPSFPEASSLAAGFFRIQAPTLADEVAAVRGAMLANPMDSSVAVNLAHFCLKHAAYEAAANVLELQAKFQYARSADEGYDTLLADYVVALWGAGRPETAMFVASERQAKLDSLLIQEIERQGIAMSLDERKQVHLPTAPSLATAIAAMTTIEHEQSTIAVQNAAFACDTVLDQLAKREVAPEVRATVALQSAFVQLWLNGPLEKAQAMLSKAAEYTPLADEARQRFDGWIALRQNDLARARELLAPLAESDVAARLGLAVALEQAGERQESARQYLAVARATPESAMGVWAREKLYRLLGQRPALREETAIVEDAAALPPAFVSLMRDAGSSLLLRIVPRQTDARAWDRLYFDIEIINRGTWPLAIGPEGPIMDTVTVTASVNVPGEMPRPPQIVLLPIDRSFVLEPGATLRVPIDLSVTDASAALREDTLSGALVSLHAIVNWRTTVSGFEPSPLGLEVESPVVHVSGERVSVQWIEESLAKLRDTTVAPDPELIALLSHALVRRATRPELIAPEAASALDPAGEVLASAAARLWPEARAWLVFACPKGKRVEAGKEAEDLVEVAAGGRIEIGSAVPELEALDGVLRADESFLTRIAWIVTRARRPEDPVLVASLESADPRVRAYAEETKEWMLEARDERARQLNLKP